MKPDPLDDLVAENYVSHYCKNCGKPVHTRSNHLCSLCPELQDPRKPFCETCGGTTRLGFVPSVTCSCPAKKTIVTFVKPDPDAGKDPT